MRAARAEKERGKGAAEKKRGEGAAEKEQGEGAGYMHKNSEILGNSEIRSQILTTFVPKIVPKFAISFFLPRR